MRSDNPPSMLSIAWVRLRCPRGWDPQDVGARRVKRRENYPDTGHMSFFRFSIWSNVRIFPSTTCLVTMDMRVSWSAVCMHAFWQIRNRYCAQKVCRWTRPTPYKGGFGLSMSRLGLRIVEWAIQLMRYEIQPPSSWRHSTEVDLYERRSGTQAAWDIERSRCSNERELRQGEKEYRPGRSKLDDGCGAVSWSLIMRREHFQPVESPRPSRQKAQ